jgi:hypothetical protein
MDTQHAAKCLLWAVESADPDEQAAMLKNPAQTWLQRSEQTRNSSTPTNGASPTERANEEPSLAELLSGATADQSSSTASEGPSPHAPTNEGSRLAESLRGPYHF